MSSKFIVVNDKNGGSPISLEGDINSAGVFVPAGLGVQGAAIAQSVNNRLVTDAQQAAAQSIAAQTVDGLLAAGVTVDMNAVAVTPLFTVPAGKTCIVTHVVVRNPSVSLTTASWALGFKGATFNDYAPTATHTALNASNKAIVMQPASAETIGAAADVFSANVTIQQGAPATAVFDVYGYLI